MSTTVVGNSVVVNALMRWPILIPVAVGVGAATVLPDPPPAEIRAYVPVETPVPTELPVITKKING